MYRENDVTIQPKHKTQIKLRTIALPYYSIKLCTHTLTFDPSVVLTYIAVLAGQGGLGGCGCIDNGGGGEGRLGAAAAAGAGGRGRERPLKHLLGCAALP